MLYQRHLTPETSEFGQNAVLGSSTLYRGVVHVYVSRFRDLVSRQLWEYCARIEARCVSRSESRWDGTLGRRVKVTAGG